MKTQNIASPYFTTLDADLAPRASRDAKALPIVTRLQWARLMPT